MFIILDTETNGFPTRLLNKGEKNGSTGRAAQIAYQIADKNGNVIKSYNTYIYPDGWEIPNKKFFIDNGMTTERLIEKGIPIKDALQNFIKDYNKCDYLVAHNIQFDYTIMHNEMISAGLKANKVLTKICTMMEAYYQFNLPKYPKLMDLHYDLIGEGFDDAHDALADVNACRRILFNMIENKTINLDENGAKLFKSM